MYNDEDRSIFDVFEVDTTESTPINTAWQPNHEEFKDFDGSTGFSLPKDDKVMAKARYLLYAEKGKS